MPPADNTPPVPEPKAPKVGFFAKLFGKKPAPEAPVVPSSDSNTPPPQLDDPALPPETSDVTPGSSDPLTGAPAPSVESAPDASGDVTVPSLDVPGNVADSSQGETPTLPVDPAAPSTETPQGVSGDPTKPL